MQSRFSSIVIGAFLALPILAAATAIPRDGTQACSTGALNCCTSVQTVSSLPPDVLLGLLGVLLGPVTALVGVGCSPLSIVGVGGPSCSSQAACCSGNTFNGLVTLACSPINLGL